MVHYGAGNNVDEAIHNHDGRGHGEGGREEGEVTKRRTQRRVREDKGRGGGRTMEPGRDE